MIRLQPVSGISHGGSDWQIYKNNEQVKGGQIEEEKRNSIFFAMDRLYTHILLHNFDL